MNNITKLRRQIRAALTDLKVRTTQFPVAKCNANGCGAEPFVSTIMVTASPDGRQVELYVFCEEHWKNFTGENKRKVIAAPTIMQGIR